MPSPSWVELVGRNAAAEAVSVSGTLVVTESPDETVRYDFAHAPGGRWRIDRDGQTIYVAGPERTVIRIDGEMRLMDGDIRVPILGTHFTPLDLLGADSLLRKLSQDVAPIGNAQGVEVAGRPAWSVPLAAPGQGTIHVAFDDATGVLSRVANDDGRALLDLEHLDVSASSGKSFFAWDGPVGEPLGRRGRPPQNTPDLDEQIAFTRAMVAAQERADEVMFVIRTAESEPAARAALSELLDVPGDIADAVAAARLSLFRSDMAVQTRRTLRSLEEQRSTGI
ncbi:hypothetical protein [Williamsia serinedens]|uniref:Uncharacterized protein n=1 Tax=Williamsia serinedens TaxID=391736 RepID=A0ABT1H081_9NOCA|nr:hypothetical protein [Williamsia serinedens]MCP2160030.1 hypothetical protein [Williamsia serinedens]